MLFLLKKTESYWHLSLFLLMASAVELSEYDTIAKELKHLRNKCELQGKNVKEVICSDPALSM